MGRGLQSSWVTKNSKRQGYFKLFCPSFKIRLSTLSFLTLAIILLQVVWLNCDYLTSLNWVEKLIWIEVQQSC